MLRSRVSHSAPDAPGVPPGAPAELPPATDTLGAEVGTEDGGGAAGGAMVPTLDMGLRPTLSLTKLGFCGGILEEESRRF